MFHDITGPEKKNEVDYLIIPNCLKLIAEKREQSISLAFTHAK